MKSTRFATLLQRMLDHDAVLKRTVAMRMLRAQQCIDSEDQDSNIGQSVRLQGESMPMSKAHKTGQDAVQGASVLEDSWSR